MKNLEIERKWLVLKENLPNDLKTFNKKKIEQAYLLKEPSIRIRKCDNKYFLNIKTEVSSVVREEYEIEISKKAYTDLLKKIDSKIISKTRYIIPYKKYKIELDCFSGELKGLYYAEVEFKSLKEANAFVAPSWFDKELTNDKKYNNVSLAYKK